LFTVIVPARAAPVFAAIETVIVPLPVPLVPDVIVMNAALLVAVHVQVPSEAVTVMVCVDAPPPTESDVGDGVTVHGEGVRNVSVAEYALVTVPFVARACQYHSTLGPRSRGTTPLVVPLPWATPSTENVRTGSAGNVGRSLISYRYVMGPSTVPVAVALLTMSVGRVVLMVTPPTGAFAVGAESVPVDTGAAALWLIVKVVPATVSVALRAAPVLAATENVTVPLPVPDAPAVTVTNVALLVAVQVQVLADVVTGTEPVPPDAANEDAVMVPAVTVQDGVVGVVVVLLLSFEHATASIAAVAAPHTATRRRPRITHHLDC
jgi:hypothetical protein